MFVEKDFHIYKTFFYKKLKKHTKYGPIESQKGSTNSEWEGQEVVTWMILIWEPYDGFSIVWVYAGKNLAETQKNLWAETMQIPSRYQAKYDEYLPEDTR